MSNKARCWVVVPAAGVGQRMGAQIPKQYLSIAGRRVIDHTLERLLNHPRIAGIYLALSAEDKLWQECEFADDPRIVRVEGGEQRCHSVLNALRALKQQAVDEDWVLVHDAARPCLSRKDLDRLIDTLIDHPLGGLLGIPVRDTLKSVNADGEVEGTVTRNGLWHALTPQMFRLGILYQALENVVAKGALVTDDASAIELAGYRPLMVEGEAGNIKITRPEDLLLAADYLSR
ncbi:MAG: 2-C-methyl-D-erythritol 4-phosphate cytidylyltransferase [Candidatus Thiodiazotropha sp.]|jgi:2-C-methyl-D-erythritol 4-phosphate cytidylyltransferase